MGALRHGKMRVPVPLPNDKLENELRKDHAAMKIMFFTEPPSFDVLEAVKQLEDRLNRLGA